MLLLIAGLIVLLVGVLRRRGHKKQLAQYGYPPPGHAQPGYPQQPYPQQPYPQQGYPQQPPPGGQWPPPEA